MAVDENCGRAGDTGAAGQLQIFLDAHLAGGGVAVTIKGFHVQAYVFGEFGKLVRRKFIVVLVEKIMVLPEFSLLVSGIGGKGCQPSLLVEGQGIIFEDDFNGVRIMLEHLLEKGAGLGAVRSLEITENRHCHRSVGITEKGAVRIINGDNQTIGDLVDLAG